MLVPPDLEIGYVHSLDERSVVSSARRRPMIVMTDIMSMLYFMRLFIKKLDVYVVDTRQRRERRCIWTRKID